jgi:hypothetical protein
LQIEALHRGTLLGSIGAHPQQSARGFDQQECQEDGDEDETRAQTESALGQGIEAI